jgi:ACS family D-galactonate transporter-like MFS transporter
VIKVFWFFFSKKNYLLYSVGTEAAVESFERCRTKERASMTHRRYRIVALLFCATFVAYMDRVNFAVSVPAIQHDYKFSLAQIGDITFAWSLVYAVFNFPGGWIADRLGLRFGMAAALGWWSVFTIASPFSTGLFMWCALRALMGAGEAPIWSYNAKATDDWVAADERSTAYSWGGAGEFLGPAAGALVAGWIAATLGWRWSFVIFGGLGLVLAPVWIALVRNRPADDPHLDEAERERIGARNDKAGADWRGLRDVVFSRAGAGILLTYVANGYVLYTFKNWLPAYMHDSFHSSIVGGAAWASLSSGLGFIGFVLAGPANDALVRRMDRLTARRVGTAIPTIIAIGCLLGSVWTAHLHSAWATATLIGLAQLLCTMTAGAWAVSVIDLSPSAGSTGILYGFYNGSLNLMGAANSLGITWIAAHFGFPIAFGSTVVFMALFMAGMVWVVDCPGYERLLRAAAAGRQ